MEQRFPNRQTWNSDFQIAKHGTAISKSPKNQFISLSFGLFKIDAYFCGDKKSPFQFGP
jgi:hypothetical protein